MDTSNDRIALISTKKIIIKRFFKYKPAVISLLFLVFLLIVTTFAPFFATHDMTKVDLTNVRAKPGAPIS